MTCSSAHAHSLIRFGTASSAGLMASFSLEEGEKKARDFLDLKHVVLSSEAEVRRWMEKIPDLKIRLEKVLEREVGHGAEGGGSVEEEPLCDPFTDPVPPAMREVNLKELGRVDINWRMLTMARPKTKIEEDLFSRLVQLEKLEYRTLQWEEEGARREPRGASHLKLLESGARGGGGPGGRRGGGGGAVVADTRLPMCRECGEELCTGSNCRKYTYEECARSLNPMDPGALFHPPKPPARPKKPLPPPPPPAPPVPAPPPPAEKAKKTKRKSKKVKKSKKKDNVAKDEPGQ